MNHRNIFLCLDAACSYYKIEPHKILGYVSTWLAGDGDRNGGKKERDTKNAARKKKVADFINNYSKIVFTFIFRFEFSNNYFVSKVSFGLSFIEVYKREFQKFLIHCSESEFIFLI